MRSSMVQNNKSNIMHTGKKLTRQLIFTKTRNDNLKGIKNLNLWGNQLEDLSILSQMPNLEVISLSVNSIGSLKYFENCLKLQELYLRKNQIVDLDEIRYLTELPELKVLWLCDNPCATAKDYREKVIGKLKRLTKLDNDMVTQGQREQAQNDGYGQDEYDNGTEQIQSPIKAHQHQNYSYNNYSSINKPNDTKSHKKSMPQQSPRQQNYFPINSLQQNQSEFYEHKRNQQNSKRQSIKNVSERQKYNERHTQHAGQGRDSMRRATNQVKQQGFKPMKQKTGNKGSQVRNRQQQQNFVHPKVMSKNIEPNPTAYSNHKEPHKYPPVSVKSKQPSSPNVIMAIMSLLDDLDQDGLEIILRQTHMKLQEKRRQEEC